MFNDNVSNIVRCCMPARCIRNTKIQRTIVRTVCTPARTASCVLTSTEDVRLRSSSMCPILGVVIEESLSFTLDASCENLRSRQWTFHWQTDRPTNQSTKKVTTYVAPEPGGSSSHSQQPNNGPCLEPDESTPHSQPITPRSILIPSSHIHLGLQSKAFPPKPCTLLFPFPCMPHDTPTLFSLIDLPNYIWDEYKLWRS
jgi:hypothetical protein